MPNIFRNSPIDSLTSAVNSLHQRQQDAQRGQMQMMQLDAELKDKEAERSLLPKRLELEEERLGYEMKMGEMGMNLEVAKTAMAITTQKLNNFITYDQFTHDKSLRPYEVSMVKMQNEEAAIRLGYLPVQLAQEVLTAEQKNNIYGISILAGSLDTVASSIAHNVQAIGMHLESQGVTNAWFANKSYTLGHNDVPIFKNKGQEQLFKAAQRDNSEVTPQSFFQDSMQRVAAAAERVGDFTNENGDWQDKGDAALMTALEIGSEEVYRDILYRLAFQSGEYTTEVNRIEELEGMDEGEINTPQTKELNRLKENLLRSIQYDGEKFHFKDFGSVQGGKASAMIWDSIFNDTDALTNFKQHMMANAGISKQNYMASGATKLIDLIFQKTSNVATGIPSEAGMAAVAQAGLNIKLNEEKFLGAIGKSGWKSPKDTKALKAMILNDPERFGIIGLQGDENISKLLYGLPEFDRE